MSSKSMKIHNNLTVTKLMFALPFQIIIIEYLVTTDISGYIISSNYTNTYGANGILFNPIKTNDTPTINSTAYLKREDYLANHRMDTEEDGLFMTGNTTSGRNPTDREASGSILRPQLAVQIYTNPPAGTAKGTVSSFNLPSSSNNRPTSTMVIVPLAKSQPSKYDYDHDLQRKIMSLRYQGGRQSSGDKSIAKLNHWHYITDQGIGSDTVESISSSNQSPSTHSNNYQPGTRVGGPLINAIITVPTPNEHHHHHHHQTPMAHKSHNRLNYPLISSAVEDRIHNATVGSIEQSLSKIIEDQTSSGSGGNVEFSMNLNGDEIIINPVTNKARILSGFNGTQGTDDPEDSSTSANSKYSDRGGKSITSRSLTKQLDTGSQHSASEIDLVDGQSEDDDRDADYERPQSSKHRSTANDDTTESKSRRHTDKDSDSSESSENNRDELRPRKYWSSIYPETSHQPPSSGGNSDERMADETTADGRSTSANNRLSSNQSDDKIPSNDLESLKSKHQLGSGKSSGRSSSRKAARKFSGSRRRATYRSEDRSLNDERSSGKWSATEGKAGKSSDVPSVVIKGEDVRKFEKLLENLRSLPMENMGPMSKTGSKKRVSKASKLVPQIQVDSKEPESDTDDEDYSSKNDGHQASPNLNGKRRSSIYASLRPSSSTGSRQRAEKRATPPARHTEPEEDSNDDSSKDNCEKRRQKQQQKQYRLQKAASNEDSTYEESSPNSVNQGPNQVGDGSLDDTTTSIEDNGAQDSIVANNDDNEHEEQGSNNHNKISSPPASESLEAEVQAQQLAADSQQDGEKPEPVVVKTVVQTYYDSNGNQQSTTTSHSSEDDLKEAHQSQHESIHDGQLSSETAPQPVMQQQASVTGTTGSQYRKNQASRYRQIDVGPPDTSYIDYSNLGEGEIIRGDESTLVKTIIAPRKYLERVRSLTLLGNALDRPRSKAVKLA